MISERCSNGCRSTPRLSSPLGGSDRHDRAWPAVEADSVARTRRSLHTVTFPDLVRQIEESMAVAIDGEIFQDACFAPAQPRKRDLSDPQDRRRLTAPLGPDHSSGTPSLRRPAK